MPRSCARYSSNSAAISLYSADLVAAHRAPVSGVEHEHDGPAEKVRKRNGLAGSGLQREQRGSLARGHEPRGRRVMRLSHD